jgi:hypothetical protein
MMVGLAGATVMLMVEMTLYILRSSRAEKELEGRPAAAGGAKPGAMITRSPISSAPVEPRAGEATEEED